MKRQGAEIYQVGIRAEDLDKNGHIKQVNRPQVTVNRPVEKQFRTGQNILPVRQPQPVISHEIAGQVGQVE